MEAISETLQPVTVRRFLSAGSQKMPLELVAGEGGLDRHIEEPVINRPAFALTGFYRYFAHRRVQVFGAAEQSYLSSLSPAVRRSHLDKFLGHNIPCLVVARNRKLLPELVDLAEKHEVPILRTSMVTGHFINAATMVMETLAAKQTKFQGTMIEISGVGVLMEGKPGVGKSETALALLEKGYVLVSDDVTLLRVDSSGGVIGAPVDVTQYHMEIRGLGIIHVPSLFGVSSVRGEKELNLVVSLYLASPSSDGLRDPDAKDTVNVLGVQVPHISIPVAPGRALPHLVEAAALDQKLRMLGHDAAKELDAKLIHRLSKGAAHDG